MMMAADTSGERALRALCELVPWFGIERLPRVADTFAVGVKHDTIELVAFDAANDRRHAFPIERVEDLRAGPVRLAESARFVIHAPFN
jgi:hypothetical protein